MAHTTEHTVTWDDTDAGGLIYFPRFFHFVVVGLNDYFSPAADGAHPMEHYRKRGYLLPAVDASASFRSPLRAGDGIAIETTVVHVGEASLAVEFSVARADGGETVAEGDAAFVFVDAEFRPEPLPEEIRECAAERGDFDTT